MHLLFVPPYGTRVRNAYLPSAEALGYDFSSRKAGLRSQVI